MKFTKIVATVNASTCTPELLLALYKNCLLYTSPSPRD